MPLAISLLERIIVFSNGYRVYNALKCCVTATTVRTSGEWGIRFFYLAQLCFLLFLEFMRATASESKPQLNHLCTPRRLVCLVLSESSPGAIARSVAMSLGNQGAPRSILASGTSFCEDLVMKIFLRQFFQFR